MHYHNREILALYGADRLSEAALLKHVLFVTRYALLVSGGPLIIVPKYFYEVPYWSRFLWHLRPVDSSGLLVYASENPDFATDVDKKRRQYRDQQELFPVYFDPLLADAQLERISRLPWTNRPGPSATQAIADEWESDVEDDSGELATVAAQRGGGSAAIDKARYSLAGVPAALEERAFVLSHVKDVLPFALDGGHQTVVNQLLNRPYLRLYVEALDASIVVDTPLGQLDCGLAAVPELSNRLVSLRRVQQLFGMLGIRETIEERLRWSDLVILREDPVFQWILGHAFATTSSEDTAGLHLEEALRMSPVYEFCNEFRDRAPRSIAQLQAHFARLHAALGRWMDTEIGLERDRVARASREWLSRWREPPTKRPGAATEIQLPLLPDAETKGDAYAATPRKIGIGILTVREDEFEAVLKRFPDRASYHGNRFYEVAEVECEGDLSPVRVAMLRATAQGSGPASDATRDLIEDLDPSLVILLGIGGGLPSTEYTLGDVVLATSVQDLRVRAVIDGAETEYAATGARAHKAVASLLAHLPALDLAVWRTPESVGVERPSLALLADSDLYGPVDWQAKVRESLISHFDGPAIRDRPKAVTGAIASSDVLVKNAEAADDTRRFVRQILAFEMEAAGVFDAADRRQGPYPVLVVRGISDIVGLTRRPEWTEYACQTAASLVKELVVSGWLSEAVP